MSQITSIHRPRLTRMAMGCALTALACSGSGSDYASTGSGGSEAGTGGAGPATEGAGAGVASTGGTSANPQGTGAGGSLHQSSGGQPGTTVATDATGPVTGGTSTIGAGGNATGGIPAGVGGGGTATGGSDAGGTDPATGGSSGADGTDPTTGGSSGAGGTDPTTGGSSGAGGTDPATGGSSGAGGTDPATGGSSGAGAGGDVATGGSGGSTPSTGCGASTWPASARYSIDVSGTTREYILDVPSDYDPNRPYRLIFAWHWLTGSAQSVVSGGMGGAYYGLQSRAGGSAILVAPEGIDAGWANTGGRDIAFLQAMLDRFRTELCIDESRIFSTGWSYGGMMSLAIGCAMGDVFRAIAPMSGALYSGCEDGNDPVAFWGCHGDADGTVPITNGRTGRDEFVARSGCDTTTTPVEPSGCVTYQGCEAGYPVTWCEFSGGHTVPSFAGDALWDFFSQF